MKRLVRACTKWTDLAESEVFVTRRGIQYLQLRPRIKIDELSLCYPQFKEEN